MNKPALLTMHDTLVDLSGFETSRAIGMALLRHAFGPSYVAHMCQSVGPRPRLAALTDTRSQVVFAALYTDTLEIREQWAARVWPLSVTDAAAILSEEAVIFDYTAVAPDRRGRWPGYFRECCRYLASQGFQTLYSECQLLRQVALFQSMGLHLLNPPPYEVRRQVSEMASAWRRCRQSGREPDLNHFLGTGESLFFYQGPFFQPGTWNVFLAEPVYIRVALTAGEDR